MSLREKNIQNEIRLWCGLNNILCFRCNVGKWQTIDGGWIDTGLPAGFPDLLILTNDGRTIYCEVKTAIGKQRQCQIDFMNDIRARGHTYIVARKIDDVKEVIYG